MPSITTRVGVPQILLSVDSTTAVPHVSALTFTASGVSPAIASDLLLNDVNTSLSASDTYNVIVGLVGRDLTRGGYTVTACSPQSGSLSISSGQVIRVNVTNGNWPANFNYCVCAVVFLKINSGNYQIAKFAYVDQSTDFYTAIVAKPLAAAPSFSAATLQGASGETTLGSRDAGGITFEEITPTTGQFNFRRAVSNVTISPNTGADFQVATTRTSSVRFESLTNDIKDFVRAAAGNYVQYSAGSNTIEEGEMSLNTAVALFRGNRPLKVIMPPDSQGFQEIRLLIGVLTTNQAEISEAWGKTNQTSVTYDFQAAALDRLISSQHTELQYKLKTS